MSEVLLIIEIAGIAAAHVTHRVEVIFNAVEISEPSVFLYAESIEHSSKSAVIVIRPFRGESTFCEAMFVISAIIEENDKLLSFPVSTPSMPILLRLCLTSSERLLYNLDVSYRVESSCAFTLTAEPKKSKAAVKKIINTFFTFNFFTSLRSQK